MFSRLIGLCLLVATALLATSVHAQIYVKADAVGMNDGTSWTHAYTDLQSALAAAIGGDQIWVAADVYYPTTGTDRTIAFELQPAVALYGGFAGTETLLNERNISLNVTILSGDIGIVSDNSDNAYNVLRATFVGSPTVLDGFTVTDGNADESTHSFGGGGLWIENASPTVANVTFDGNTGWLWGGGILLEGGNPAISNTTFSDNSVTSVILGHGGGMYCRNGAPSLTDVVFSGNTSAADGGGLYVVGGDIGLTRVTFTANTSHGMYYTGVGNPVLDDCLFENHTTTAALFMWGNVSSSMTVSETTFQNNTATALGLNTGADVTLNDCMFVNNDGGFNGGAIDGTNGSEVTATNTHFDSNTASQSGGAIWGITLDLTDCSFTSNECTAGPGGAITASTSVYDDVTFTNNTAASDGGAVNGDGTFTDVTFTGNSSGNDGGAVSGDGTFTDAIFSDNFASNDGGAVSGDFTFTDAIFAGNFANGDGGAVEATGTGTFTNALFYDNTALSAGGALLTGASTLTNVTIADNRANSHGAIAGSDGGRVIINSLIWGNTSGTAYTVAQSGTISYSLIEGTGGSGGGWPASVGVDGGSNVDGDPQFVDFAGGDYRVGVLSPAANAGNNAAPNIPPLDLAGNPRILDGTVEMGVYEIVCPGVSRLYVDDDAAGAGDGTSWADAFTTLAEALGFACGSVTEIWVRDGIYKPTIGSDRTATFRVLNGIEIYGSFGGFESDPGQRNLKDYPSILSGEIGSPSLSNNSYHVVTSKNTDATAVLDGFIIEAGNADGTPPDDVGGGMINDGGTPTIRNVDFRNNLALSSGAGLANDNGDATLINVVFDENSSIAGGALSNFNSSPTLTNATFSNNFSPSGGTINNVGSSPTVYNTIIYGNVGGGPISNTGGSAPVFANCLIEGSGGSGAWGVGIGVDGGSNIDVDPLFVDGPNGDLRLSILSPALGAGDNGAPNLPLRDRDGVPRILGVTVDMGAYETTSPTGIDPQTPLAGAGFRSAYPNPFNPTVTIAYQLTNTAPVTIKVYDVSGRQVRTLLDGERLAGPHTVNWDATDSAGQRVATGVYIVRIETSEWREQCKITLLK